MISYLRRLLNLPIAYAQTYGQSFLTSLTTGRKPAICHWEDTYSGQPILIYALFQAGTLRPDVERTMRAARELGFYVLAVNTKTLEDPAEAAEYLNCYLERPNFGRDFGSYKTGLLRILDKGWHKTCPRLILLNDSVFVSSSTAATFLEALRVSDLEVAGATENFEIEHHLGSFCLSLSPAVLQKSAFWDYWREYRLSDIRPKVIRKGEMKLSRVLKSCVRAPDRFGALYSAAWFQRLLDTDAQMTNRVMSLGRNSDLVDWPRTTAKGMLEFVSARFLVARYDLEGTTLQAEATLSDLNIFDRVSDYQELLEVLRSRLGDQRDLSENNVKALVDSFLLQMFIRGSQIHQNAAVLLSSGLPLIKLDGLYRGMFDTYDIHLLSSLLPPQEREEFLSLILQRPYGGHALRGWKQAAFLHGLI